MSTSINTASIEGFGLHNGEQLGFQSWYLGYVLAFTLVLAVLFGVQLAKKRRNHLMLWLPLTIMFILTAVVFILREKTEESTQLMEHIYASHRSAPPGFGVDTPPFETKDVVLHFLNLAGFSRWTKHWHWYLLATEIFAVIAFIISSKLKAYTRSGTSGRCFFVAALLLAVCLLDRHYALSARLLFEKNEQIKNTAALVNITEFDGYKQYFVDIDWRDTCFLSNAVYAIRLGCGVAGYAKPKAFSEILGYMEATSNHALLQRTIFPMDKPGWYGGDNLWRVYDSEFKSVWTRGPVAFVRAEQLIRSASSYKQNGILGVIARPWLTANDLGIYTLGIAVPPNIMHVFVPFEIYLLAPLAAIFGITWLALLIRSRITKCKASTT